MDIYIYINMYIYIYNIYIYVISILKILGFFNIKQIANNNR